jgi:hypothetical protein
MVKFVPGVTGKCLIRSLIYTLMENRIEWNKLEQDEIELNKFGIKKGAEQN